MLSDSLIAIPASTFCRTSAKPGVSQNLIDPTTFCSNLNVSPFPILKPDRNIICDANAFRIEDFPIPGFPIAMTLSFTRCEKKDERIFKFLVVQYSVKTNYYGAQKMKMTEVKSESAKDFCGFFTHYFRSFDL